MHTDEIENRNATLQGWDGGIISQPVENLGELHSMFNVVLLVTNLVQLFFKEKFIRMRQLRKQLQ